MWVFFHQTKHVTSVKQNSRKHDTLVRRNAINLKIDLHNHNLCNRPNCDMCGLNCKNASIYILNSQILMSKDKIFSNHRIFFFFFCSHPSLFHLLCGDNNSSFGKNKKNKKTLLYRREYKVMSNTDIGFNIDFYTLCYVKTIQLNCVSYMYISVTGKHYNIYFIVCFNGYQISRGDFGVFFLTFIKLSQLLVYILTTPIFCQLLTVHRDSFNGYVV